MIRDVTEACRTPDAAFVVDRAIVVTALAINAQTNLVYTPRVEASPQTCMILEVSQLTEFVDSALNAEELRGRNDASVGNAPRLDARQTK